MPKSILKNAVSSISAQSREDRNRETAFYHAQLLQQRKDVEALILASTEALLELPSSPAADPARPCLQDANLVKNSLKTFQPSDYDSMIEERNINKQCGYVLCAKPNREEDTKAKYRILPSKKGDAINFVERHTLERWCSDDCGKRALYIKVQLCEEPAWTRAGSAGGSILLLEDEQDDQKKHADDYPLVEKLKSIGLEDDEVVTRMKFLAIERGDAKTLSRSFGLEEIEVREKKNVNRMTCAPEHSTKAVDAEGSCDSIEGYTPKFPRKEGKDRDSDTDEDLMPTI